MDLDRALDARIVRHLDVGIAAADVREHDAILVLERLETGRPRCSHRFRHPTGHRSARGASGGSGALRA
jgi:hypothetical protein